jgi:uncharacterized membrane protein
VRSKLRWVFWRRLPFGGLAGALAFFCLSMSPSLLPRGQWLQGIIAGVTAVIGYGLGCAVSSGIRKVRRSEPSPRAKLIAWWSLLGATIVLVPLSLGFGRYWQNDVRRLMGMGQLELWSWGAILLIAVLIAALLLVISRFVRGGARVLIRQLDKVVPRWVSVTAGVGVTIVIVTGLIQGFILTPALDGLNAFYSSKNANTEPGVTAPTSPYRSGGPGSLVPWDTLGIQGRDFTGTGPNLGPSTEQLSSFNGAPATPPIRVYVGLKSADTLHARVELALKELDRTHAWSRKLICVFTTTGTGWVDENAASPLEYMFNGDTAEVALQYSYLPSWISFLVDTQKAADAGREMIHAVEARLAAMPAASRPKLYVFGESLGSFGTESAFANIDEMLKGVDGALLAGPVFKNPIHNQVTDDRESGTPFWRPIYRQGLNVRFVVSPPDLASPPGEWSHPRVVYLQNATDPITYGRLNLIWSYPAWLHNPRGPDVSSHMFWVPVVTFWQVLADMAFSTGVPAGHGHNYGVEGVNSWAAVTQPPGWTVDKTERLRALLPS